MSIRTIVEINHDYLKELKDNPESMQELYQKLDGRPLDRGDELIPGVEFLTQRHHSEGVMLCIGSPAGKPIECKKKEL